jgi:hypothetical protein
MMRYESIPEEVLYHDLNCNVRFSARGHEQKVRNTSEKL